MDGIRSVDLSKEAADGSSYLDGALQVVYESIADLNQQLPPGQRIEKSPATVLFGEDGKLDSLGLANLIVITEQRIEEFFGFAIGLTEDDPFSPSTGHFRTVQSLATYISQSAARERGGALPQS